MTINDEMLMAFADGELQGEANAQVEAAMRDDAQIAARVAAHRAMRQRLQAAFAAELSEPIPERLLSAVNRAPSLPQATVTNLKDARESRARDAMIKRPRTWWRPVAAIAASLLIGFGLGHGGFRQSDLIMVQNTSGAMVASGQLAQALSRQLTHEQSSTSAVQIGMSFLAKSGDYCRTFSLSGGLSPAGLACHRGQEWQIKTLVQGAGEATGDYRTAASPIPPAILKAVEAQMADEPMDSAAESAARAKDWTPSTGPAVSR
jgi:anti-sigma-K factor RskA